MPSRKHTLPRLRALVCQPACIIDLVFICTRNAEPLLTLNESIFMLISLNIGSGLFAGFTDDAYVILAHFAALLHMLFLHLIALDILLRNQARVHKCLLYLLHSHPFLQFK
jgi:hypothetical protein